MAVLLATSGVTLIGLALLDLFVTVLTTRGGGPVSSRVGAACWHMILRVHRSHASPIALAYAGSLIAISTVFGWILMFWIGWLLIFSAGPESIVRTSTEEPADVWARLYFSGYTLFTLGLGDYRPLGALWQLLTAIAVGNGFIVISLSASYLIPLVSAASAKRSTALYINGLGASPSDILISTWDGKRFPSLSHHLVALCPMIIQAGQQHLAYPVLHYFQTTDTSTALPVQIARLAEALDLLEHAVDPEGQLPAGATRPAREATHVFGQVLQRAHAPRPSEAPPAIDLEPLRRAGIPVVSEAAYQEALARQHEKRRGLLGVVRYSGWSWGDVTGTSRHL